MARAPKVRKPKKADELDDDDDIIIDDDEEDTAPAKPVVKETAPEPSADVILKGCASLSRAGKTYVKDRLFTVFGEEKIAYYESDTRFRVTRKK